MHSIKAFDKGTFDYRGSYAPNEHYFVRYDDSEDPPEENRCFFAFDVGELDVREYQCRLRIEVPDPQGFRSPNAVETFSIHRVLVAQYDRVLQGGMQPFFFRALGDGPQFAEILLSRADRGTSAMCELNLSGQRELRLIMNQSADDEGRKLFLLGGKLIPTGLLPGNRRIFQNSANSDVFLDLE